MALSRPQAVEQAKALLELRRLERPVLDTIRSYWRGSQGHPIIPSGVATEVRRLAAMSRVNLITMAVAIPAQSLYVAGYRAPRVADDAPAWASWEANKMDKGQVGVHRAALAYGCAYTVVTKGQLNGEPRAVIRGVSPRNMTTLYGEDDTWPLWALEVVPNNGKLTLRLYDDELRYTLEWGSDRYGDDPVFVDAEAHLMEVAPVVRFRNVEDLDQEDVTDLPSEVLPLIPLQDQMDMHTFGLLVVEHFQAFRMRYITGWTTETEEERLKAGASRFLTFEDPDVKVGELQQADLNGYLASRTSTQEFLATIAQVPPHNMIGKMVQMSAEALAAAESGHRRKLTERETGFGSSWDQTLSAAAWADGVEVEEGARVRWRDTEARALAATVDALGKLAQMLGVPPRMLWERVPGITEQELERWNAAADAGDSFANLTDVLERQAGAAEGDGAPTEAEDLKARADAMGALIRAGVDPDDAARRSGLEGLTFVGSPAAVRLQTDAAAGLEDV